MLALWHYASSLSYLLKRRVYRLLTLLKVCATLLASYPMSDTLETPTGRRTPLDEGDIESLSVSLTTSPHRLITVSLESNFLPRCWINLNHVTVITRPSDCFKLRSAQQRHTANLSAANSKTSRMALRIAPSPSPNVPRPLMDATNPTRKLLTNSIISSTSSSRLGTSFV